MHVDGLDRLITEPTASTDQQIDAICDAYEAAWISGSRPDPRAFLELAATESQARLLHELLLVEAELCSRGTEQPDWHGYLTKFAEFADQVESARFKSWPSNIVEPFDDSGGSGPRIIDRFELLDKIGSGGSGDVWKARDPRLQRIVAIKIARGVQLSDEELGRFFREARAAAQLRHENIVPVYEIGRDGSTAYIVSAFIPGCDLRKRLTQWRPVPRQAAELCAELADALHHAHEQEVIHRDLKPSNVIIDYSDRAHITDFGLAKWADGAPVITMDGRIVGTPAYMSPEQAMGRAAEADGRSDVYSLGVILYELLTSHCPFTGTQASIAHQIIHQEPRRPRSLDRGIPRDLETICLKSLEKEPERRYSTAREMAADLRRFLAGQPILARRISHIERSWRWLRRHPALAVVGVLAVITLSALALARKTASEMHALMGLRNVAMETEPAGARVAIVPLNRLNNEPDLDKIFRPDGRTPLTLELAPGDYLVVAEHDDGRFHEVFRTVPRPNESKPFLAAYEEVADEARTVRWQKFTLFPHSHHDEMLYVGQPTVTEHGTPAIGRQPPAFFMSVGEFQVSDQTKLDTPNNLQLASWDIQLDGTVGGISYPQAVALAERIGMRLPSDAEYDQALFWFRLTPSTERTLETAQANTASDESLEGCPVKGLLSGVAEWTTTGSGSGLEMHSQKIHPSSAGSYRWIRGALFDAHPEKRRRDATCVDKNQIHPWVGFRFVRSAGPRFMNGESR